MVSFIVQGARPEQLTWRDSQFKELDQNNSYEELHSSRSQTRTTHMESFIVQGARPEQLIWRDSQFKELDQNNSYEELPNSRSYRPEQLIWRASQFKKLDQNKSYGVFKQFYDQNGKCLKNLFLIIIITFSEEEKLFSCLRKKSFAYMFFFVSFGHRTLLLTFLIRMHF